MNAIIRQAKQIDATSLARLAESTFRETFSHENLATNIEMHCLQNFSSEIQEQEILNSNIVTFVAEIESTLVGFAQLRLKSAVNCIKASRPSELYRLYVSNEQQGTGLVYGNIIQGQLHSIKNMVSAWQVSIYLSLVETHNET